MRLGGMFFFSFFSFLLFLNHELIQLFFFLRQRFVGNPADVALTRTAGDARLPIAERRNYRNGIDALIKIGKEEGVKGLFSGVVPNVQRSIVVNAVMLTSYSQTKDSVKRRFGMEEGVALQFLAGNVSGFLTALLALPFDFIKTKIQYEKTIQQKQPHDAMTTVKQIIKEKGIKGLWVGFVPFWLKLAPHTTITFIVIEYGRSLIKLA